MGLFSKLRSRVTKLLGLGSKPMSGHQDVWTKAYSNLILEHGAEADGEALESAGKLGLDVKALIEEHKRRKAASWCVEFHLDLVDVEGDDLDMEVKVNRAGVPEREIQTQGRPLCVDVAGLYKRIELPHQTMPMTRLVVLGIRAMQQRFLEVPEEFPTNRYPRGVSDWKLTSLRWNEGSQDFYLSGWWKTEARDRKPSKLKPELSIDLRRAPPAKKQLVSSRPLPELEHITLSVWRGNDGKHEVMGVYANESSSPPPHTAAHPDQSDTLRLKFPSGNLPPLEWKVDWSQVRTSATEFLQRRCLQQAGKPWDWLHSYAVGALIEDCEMAVPATDLRASLRSGPKGPAPLQKGLEWPCCPCCAEPALFSQSLDVRDIGFADLLPGTTLVIFVCNDCLEDGQWENCSSVIWLRGSDEIVLVDRGDPDSTPLWQSGQWYGADLPSHGDLPKEVQEELERFQKVSETPYGYLPSSVGTKVGGVPFYLQQETTFYDRNGIVMEYIAQISTPGHISARGFGYVSHSAATGETYVAFQST